MTKDELAKKLKKVIEVSTESPDNSVSSGSRFGKSSRWTLFDDAGAPSLVDDEAHDRGTRRYLEFQTEICVLDERGETVFETDNVDDLATYVQKWMRGKPNGKVPL